MNEKWTLEKVKEDVWYINESGLNAMYLVRGEKLSAVIDTGTGIGDYKSKIEEILNTPYIVIITHGHVDHAGGAGQFEEIYIHPADMEAVKKITVEDRIDYIKRMEGAGAIPEGQVVLDECMKNEKKPKMIPVKEGDIFDLGDKKLEIFEFPGHTNGSICILDRKDKVLFTGDNMNDTELVTAEASDRRKLLEEWYQAGVRMLEMQDMYEICCGGHCLIPVEKAAKTVECGRMALAGELVPQEVRIHFFHAPFYIYDDIYLYSGDFKDLY